VTQFPQDRTVLVTGSGGRLGRLLRRAARRDGTGAFALAFQSRHPPADESDGDAVTWAPGDALSALPRCGTVVALWGRTAGTSAELAENVDLVAIGYAVARACGARRLLHLSSAGVYGPGRAMTEDAPLAPTSDYARAKCAMERAVSRLPSGDGIAHCCLRLANVVGADSLAPGLRRDAPVGLDRFADGGGPVRSYIAASDLMRVFCGLAALPPETLPTVLNVAAPAPLGMAALARAAGRDIDWRPAPEEAVQQVTLDTGRLCRLLPDIALLSSAPQLAADWLDLEAMT